MSSEARSWRRLFVLALGVLLAALLAVLAWRTTRFHSRQVQAPAAPALAFDRNAAVERLSQAIQLRTVSHQDASKLDATQFRTLHELLSQSFPLTHAQLQRETVADLSLLYTWRGSDPDLEPVLLLGHQDVVPVEPGTQDAWEQAPFSGAVADGHIWGRGSLDDKVAVLGILEAVEALLRAGFKPKRSVMLAFGHDEEVGGGGAIAIAKRLRASGQRLHLVLDEGSVLVRGVVPGIDKYVAVVGIAEKGYASVRLSATASGGHSAMPPADGAVALLTSALARLQQQPMPASLTGPVSQQLDYLGPEMPLGLRMVMANRWLLGGVLQSRFEERPATNAQLRTTAAFTMLEGSIKENVLPQRAQAVINFRIKPGETIASVLAHVHAVVADPRIDIALLPGATEPTPVSRSEGARFALLQRTVAQVFPEAIFAPSLVVATTDARHYADLSDHVYRFLPARFEPQDLPRFHGTNERLSVKNYPEIVRFYAQLIRNFATEPAP